MPDNLPQTRVLLVQTIQSNYNGARSFLECTGHHVLWADSGLTAMTMVRNTTVDLILLDVERPGTEGLELCRRFRMRDKSKSIPIIMLVDRGGEPRSFISPEDRPDSYLEKPYTKHDLEAHITKVLQDKRSQTAPAEIVTLHPGPQPTDLMIIKPLPPPVPKSADRPVLKLVVKSGVPAAPAAEDEVVDPTTGLFSRQQFEAMFSKEFKQCQRFKQNMSCIMIDLDGRKMGRRADRALVTAIIGLLQQTIREVDTAAWWTGESFFVLLPNTIRNDAVQAAARLLEAVANHPFTWPDATQVSMSIGVAGLPDWNIDTEQKLIDAATEACSKALEGIEQIPKSLATWAAGQTDLLKKAAG